jgi:uncharacterized membrane protein YhaH (DUF805 family)
MSQAAMGEAAMNDSNPYSAPDADLHSGQDALYSPKILSFSGRLGRMRYLAYSLGLNIALSLAMIPFAGAAAFMGGMGGNPESMGIIGMLVMALVYIGSIVISVMFAKRRLNDLNRSGWWMLLFLVPVVNLLMVIYLLFFPGTDGANNFGPAPIANSIGVLVLGWLFIGVFVLGIVAAVAMPAMLGVAPQ